MKKLIRKSISRNDKVRVTENFNIQIYSHDRNNAGFEFVIKNEKDLSNYTPKVLFKFVDSKAYWETNGVVEGNKLTIKFDTKLITKCEEVYGYLYLDSEQDDLDVYKFRFNVVVSEIDKEHVEVKEFRYVKDTEVVDILTREELDEFKEELRSKGITIDTSNFATKQELEELRNSQPTVDSSNLATKEEVKEVKSDLDFLKNTSISKSELSKKVDKTSFDEFKERAITEHQDLSHLATKEELKEIKPTVDLTDYAKRTELSSYATQEELNRVRDNLPTAYNDKEVKDRLASLENNIVTDEKLNEVLANIPSGGAKEVQSLSIQGNKLTISGGNSVLLPIFNAGALVKRIMDLEKIVTELKNK